tara:strand:+ start:74951 stop:75337 length:387 start_codon:yes stop_codon:yes gene_type:complete
MIDPARQKAERSGRLAEWIALTVLTLKGYRVIATRQKTPLGELDLVCLKHQTVVIVEVKRRKTLIEGEWAVPAMAWQRIGRAAEIWLSKKGDRLYSADRRFDLFLVAPGFRFCHNLDAWRPENPLTHG